MEGKKADFKAARMGKKTMPGKQANGMDKRNKKGPRGDGSLKYRVRSV